MLKYYRKYHQQHRHLMLSQNARKAISAVVPQTLL
uniref:Uncharacterized protein n=1 Tax=Megaselia scalaris TaxID=36166 RepID=T1H2M3_MEGSC